MAITKTTAFLEMEIRANSEIIVTMRDTLDDPNDDDLPAIRDRKISLVPSSDITGLPSAVQTIINAAWGAL